MAHNTLPIDPVFQLDDPESPPRDWGSPIQGGRSRSLTPSDDRFDYPPSFNNRQRFNITEFLVNGQETIYSAANASLLSRDTYYLGRTKEINKKMVKLENVVTLRWNPKESNFEGSILGMNAYNWRIWRHISKHLEFGDVENIFTLHLELDLLFEEESVNEVIYNHAALLINEILETLSALHTLEINFNICGKDIMNEDFPLEVMMDIGQLKFKFLKALKSDSVTKIVLINYGDYLLSNTVLDIQFFQVYEPELVQAFSKVKQFLIKTSCADFQDVNEANNVFKMLKTLRKIECGRVKVEYSFQARLPPNSLLVMVNDYFNDTQKDHLEIRYDVGLFESAVKNKGDENVEKPIKSIQVMLKPFYENAILTGVTPESFTNLRNLVLIDLEEDFDYSYEELILMRKWFSELPVLDCFTYEMSSTTPRNNEDARTLTQFLCSMPRSLKVLKLGNFDVNITDHIDLFADNYPYLHHLQLLYQEEMPCAFPYFDSFIAFKHLQVLHVSCYGKENLTIPDNLRLLIIDCKSQWLYSVKQMQLDFEEKNEPFVIEQIRIYSNCYQKNDPRLAHNDSICHCNLKKYPFNNLVSEINAKGYLTYYNFAKFSDWLLLSKSVYLD
uniref:F-box domain-containing protein n=1 Tax=Rhabditophanes sp. KR3021 TaxID=114890 RepID=A0AC35TXT4_9BILA